MAQELLQWCLKYEADFKGINALDWARDHAEIPVFAIALYLGIVFYGQDVMNKREPMRLNGLFAVWNLGLTIFSIVGATRTIPHLYKTLMTEGFQYTCCQSPVDWYANGKVGLWVALFIYSKIPELLDTVFLVLRKRNVIFLHWFHHTTVLLYCWHAFHTHVAPGLWFAAMNYGVHSVMYLYYFLMSMRNKTLSKIAKKVAPIITSLQLLQMVIGAFVTSYAAYSQATLGSELCDVDPANWKLGLAMYTSYFLLFAFLFRNLYCSGSEKPSKKGDTVCGVEMKGGDIAGRFHARTPSDVPSLKKD